MPQEKPTKIYVDNSLVIALAKNPVFLITEVSTLTQDFII
jgi:hypothetical protein